MLLKIQWSYFIRKGRITMAQKVQTESTPRRGRGWLRALLIGLGLFIATTIVLVLTGNPNLYPTVILIGNFLVPVVFVAFLYDHQHISSLSLDTVAASFCIGGVLGVLGAAILESVVLPIVVDPTHGLSLGGGFHYDRSEEHTSELQSHLNLVCRLLLE